MSASSTETTTLDSFVTVAERFHRSVNLPRDWSEEAGLADYLVTPTARRLSERMLVELEQESGSRAWSLVGPYGSGKSAFALFLTQLLCEAQPKHSAVEAIRSSAGFDAPEFVPVLLVADRSPLEERLATALAQAFAGIDSAVVDEARALAEEDEILGQNLAALLQAATLAAEGAGRGGILLVIDEFGKFLEYAAGKPDERDLLFLQTLAEAAARSDVPVLFLTILHQGLSDYLPSQDELHRREWQKVQGRFREVPFQLPVEQLLTLLGQALRTNPPEAIEEVWQETVQSVCDADVLERVRKRVPVHEVLPETLPLNPVTALLLWPLFRSKMAQNERSLFAFLTSHEPLGFQDYLEVTSVNEDGMPPLFDTANLYDYVDQALALGSFRGEQGRRWAEIQRSLGRLPAEAGPTAEQVVKAIGLISMYGAKIGLAASREVLQLALSNDATAVTEALELLEEASIAIFRKHRNAYGLWEGSDVDLEGAYVEALRESGQTSLAQRLNQHVELQPIVARKHFIESGTLRYFDVQVVDAAEGPVREAFEANDDQADGTVIFVVGLADKEREAFLQTAKRLTSGKGEAQLRLIAIPGEVVRLDDALRDLEAWRWVQDNVAELQGDETARNEVKARISHARDVIGQKAGEVFGLAGHSFRPELSQWIQGGSRQPERQGREFQRWLSGLCDEVFSQAPELHNELLNRQSLSSASSAARRNLVEAMMASPEEERLGIEGNPAEASMYASLLRAGGFHRQTDEDRWRFAEPGAEWSDVWAHLESYLSETVGQRRVVVDLFEELKQPPFGLREGPIPVVFLAFVLAHREQVAFYEDGVYVPDVSIEVMERLLARPETFEVQSYALDAEQQEVLTALADRVVSPKTGEKLEADLLPIVRSLVRQAAELNAFTKNTKELDPPEALAVRDALLNATSPLDLLFHDLPEALGVKLEGPEDVDTFADRLRDCMLVIHRAYPALLDEIETALRNAFDLPEGPSVAAVATLRKRAQPLVEYALEDTLQVFVREAARLGNQRDWREVLGRVVQGGMPPKAWSDKDVATFQVKLRKVAGSFLRLEELVAEQGENGTGSVYRLGILREQFDERRAVVSVDDDIEGDVDRLASDLWERIASDSSGNGNSRRIRVAALARVSESLLTAEENEGSEADG